MRDKSILILAAGLIATGILLNGHLSVQKTSIAPTRVLADDSTPGATLSLGLLADDSTSGATSALGLLADDSTSGATSSLGLLADDSTSGATSALGLLATADEHAVKH